MDATFSFKDDDFVKVATGKINPHIAFIRFVFFSLMSFYYKFLSSLLSLCLNPNPPSFCCLDFV